MTYVFISYSKPDREFVGKLADDLRNAGIQAWIDIEIFPVGVSWEKALREGIRESSALIYVASANSVNSTWMQSEVSHANEMGKPVIIAVIDDDGLGQIKEFSTKWVDFRPDYHAGLNLLLKTLLLSSEVVKPEPHAIKVEATKSKGYVFISYAEEDTVFVIKLREFLKERGYGFWDYQSSDRDYHTQMFLELESVIREASATLSILSPDWKRSQWAPREFLFSEAVGIPVFLLMARDMGPTLVTIDKAYIDFVRDEQKGFNDLDRELRRKGLI